jgi:hypothetical protein
MAFVIKKLDQQLQHQSNESEDHAKAYLLQLYDLQEQLETMQQQLSSLVHYVENSVTKIDQALGLGGK